MPMGCRRKLIVTWRICTLHAAAIGVKIEPGPLDLSLAYCASNHGSDQILEDAAGTFRLKGSQWAPSYMPY